MKPGVQEQAPVWWSHVPLFWQAHSWLQPAPWVPAGHWSWHLKNRKNTLFMKNLRNAAEEDLIWGDLVRERTDQESRLMDIDWTYNLLTLGESKETKNTSRSLNHQCCLPSQFVDDAHRHLTLIPHLLGSNGSNWSSSMQMSQILHFQAILQIDLTWLLTFICDLWPHEHVKVPTLYQ